MIEENKCIFLAGGDALVYLYQCTKNILQHLLGAIQLVRTYLMTNFFNPLPFVHICTHLE